MHSRARILVAKDKLGWNPIIQLEEGLNITIPFFAELLK